MLVVSLVGSLVVFQLSSETPLRLAEVIERVDFHHPKVLAALAKENMARGELLAAKGGFDPKISADGAVRQGGYYELRRLNVEARQPTSFWGTEFWAGYRLGLDTGENSYPTYYGDETLDNGEVRAGLTVPLWRDGPLDKRRAARRKASQSLNAASQGRQATLLELRQKATDAYFSWVAAGRKLSVAKELLELAENRKTYVDARVEAGAIPAVESLEVHRSVLLRQRSLVSARRSTEASSLVLSLYYRGSNGQPILPTFEQLPNELAIPQDISTSADNAIIAALECHPLLQEGRAELAAAGISLDLARAQNAPEVDLTAQVSRDFGDGSSTLPDNVFELKLKFSMPALLRTPRGEYQAAREKAETIRQDLRLLKDTIRMRVGNSAQAYQAANERRLLAHDLSQNTRQLAQAEQKRFEAGITTLFVVNLREQSVAEAEVSEVDAVRDLWKARAEWDALTNCPSARTRSSS